MSYKSRFKLEDSGSAIRILFFVSIILLAVLSVVNYRADLDLVEKGQLVSHTNQVKFKLEQVISRIKDAETGARGFLLTRDQEVLSPFLKAETDLPLLLKEIERLVSDNPTQIRNFSRINSKTNDKLTRLRQMISGMKITPDEVRISKREMDDLRSSFSLMQFEEDRLLRDREEKWRRSVSFAPIVTVILAASSILLLVFSYFRLNRELEKSKELQSELQQTNTVLEKSNAELSQFAYVASHDLQEPLRKIQTFISRIDDDAAVLPGRTGDFFERIKISASRMQRLIRDILAYSRISNASERHENVALNEIVNEARDAVDVSAKEKNAEIIVDLLPKVNGVHYQLVQLFQNLLSNAIKFSDPVRKNIIRISAVTIPGSKINLHGVNRALTYHRITVSDTGIGFDPEYGERIFKIFQRLHLKEAYEGNGIGLSIVHKIAETHLGFVTATGEPGSGAAFSLYLPA